MAPVGGIIADDGRCVVTFDDWHGVGTGPNVVAIYGAEGSHIRSLSLRDLVTAEYKTALPRSVSSISWSGERSFSEDGRNVLLKVLVPGHDDRRNADYVDVVVNLNDGSVLRPNAQDWIVALGKARAVNEATAQAGRDRIRYLIKPLIAPTTKDESAWHTYMREAFLRITPRFLDMPVASVTILREKSARDYKASEQWVLDEFKEEEEFASGDELMFATVGSPDNLVSVLRKAAGGVKNASLKGSSIYVSIAADHRTAAAAAIASTGADFVWIDPAHAIAQRPERVPGSAEEKTAQEEMNRRQSKSFDAISKELQGKE